MNCFNLLSEDIFWYHILARNEKDVPHYRTVCMTWKKVIDDIFTQKLKAFPLKLSPGRSAVTYINLKNFVPLFFESIWSTAHKSPLYSTTENILRALELGLEGKQLELPDLLNLTAILRRGANKTRFSKIEDRTLHKGLRQLTSLFTKKSTEFGKKEPLSATLLNTVLIVQHGNLKMAVKRRNIRAQHHFFHLYQEPKILHKAFIKCLMQSSISSRRVFEKIVKETNFPQDTSSGFDHLLGHAMAINKWLRILISNVERKRNQLCITDKTRITIDSSGMTRKIKLKSEHHFSYLHQAVIDQQPKKVVDYLAQGHEIDQLDHSSRTPLMLAARGSSQKIFRFLLKKGASLKKKDMWGLTAMDWCVLTGKPQWLRICKDFDKNTADWDHALELHKEPMKHALDKTPNMVKILKAFLGF